ncbi:uncharacterized protein LOC126746312 [Anthonomus grandis grandis]|uniref:uncharacterized protein LOC126746312 n=1 Tax=Anthonomus grandis grandis TaxID=2921223 RepID=UPI0021667DF6|nr:uncharacterized protein LOC126746312 [Anthonomus grandis grandis]
MSGSSKSVNPDPLKKRKPHPELYKRNIIKHARVKGDQHVNWKGRSVSARSTGPDCNCKMHCFRTLLQADFSLYITKLNGFNTKDEQDIYLQQLIEKKSIKSHRPRKGDLSIPREYSFKYFIDSSSKKQVVCKKAFCSIYGITIARVKRLLKLKS